MLKLFNRKNLEDVFTPNTIAKLGYLKRAALESELQKNIDTPGKQIILYGHSGSGKTTLIHKTLSAKKIKYLVTPCELNMSFDKLMLDIYGQLQTYYISSKKNSTSNTISSQIDNHSIGSSITPSIGSSISNSAEENQTLLVTPQVNLNTLTKLLGQNKVVWIIEDFEKLLQEERYRIKDTLKIFIDAANDWANLKVICIGTSDSIDGLIENDKDVNPRVAKILIPRFGNDEIRAFIQKGCELLNISMPEDLQKKIVLYSNHNASFAHQICLDICYNYGIKKTSIKKFEIPDDAFQLAIQSYVNINKTQFEIKYNSINKNALAIDIIKLILQQKELNYKTISNKIIQKKKYYTIENIKKELDNLSSNNYKILKYHTRTQKYSISTPFWETFLKVQIEVEKTDHRKSKKNTHNSSLQFKNQKDIDADIYKLMLQ